MNKYWIAILVLIAGGFAARASNAQQVYIAPAGDPGDDTVIITGDDDTESQPMDAPPATAGPTTMPTTGAAAPFPTTNESPRSPMIGQGNSRRTTTGGNNNFNNNSRGGRTSRTGRSTGFATSQPSIAAPGQMTRDFDVLAERNIFIKGTQVTTITPPPDRNRENIFPPRETTLIFNGVTITDQKIVAFLEDSSNGEVFVKQAGESIAAGRITNITLDYLEYESLGRTYRVLIGQNLFGSAVAATTQPTADLVGIEARMKQKREEELKRIR